MLERLFLAGVDTFRLNFSHGTHEDHAKVHAAIRALETKVGRPIGILQDLQGPKIRVGTIKDGKIAVVADEQVRFVLSGSDGDKMSIPLPHPEVFAAINGGQIAGGMAATQKPVRLAKSIRAFVMSAVLHSAPASPSGADVGRRE